jgi:hypothetical protein
MVVFPVRPTLKFIPSPIIAQQLIMEALLEFDPEF